MAEEIASQDNLPDFACLEEIASEMIRAASGAKQIAIAKLAQAELSAVIAWMDNKSQEIADLRGAQDSLETLEETISQVLEEDIVRENDEYNKGFVSGIEAVLAYLHAEKSMRNNEKKEGKDG